MAEYYIRDADSDEARGPYNETKIADLIEAGRASGQTLYYDETQDDWFPLSDLSELSDVLNPQQKRIQLRAKSDSRKVVRISEDTRPPITVDEMLAAAEGNSEETKHLKAKAIRRDKAASLSLPALGVIFALSALMHVYGSWDTITVLREEFQWAKLGANPMLILGCVDLFLMLCCFLSVTDIFPVIRVRAMLGLGYFTYFYWSWGEYPQSIAAAVASLAMYVCTVTLNLYLMIAFSVLGILGMGFLATSLFL